MANYATLKAAINAVIKANGQREITGTVLNQTLNAMVNSLGANYQLAGVATPSTNPGTPDQNVFYLAFEAGTYTNFNATVLSAGISILMWNGSWSSQTFYTIDATPTASSNNLVSSGAVFEAIKTDGSAYDVSAHFPTGGPNNDGKFTLEYILSNANTLIPTAWRKGGMSIRFVSSIDNNYYQFRYMLEYANTTAGNIAFANPDNWQGVNEKPVACSKNLVTSDGIYDACNHEFIEVGFGLNISGSVSQSSDWGVSDYISVDDISTIKWKTGQSQNPSSFKLVIYDENKDVINFYSTTDANYRTIDLTIPSNVGAKYVRASFYLASNNYGLIDGSDNNLIPTLNINKIDNTPTKGSNNLVLSGAVYDDARNDIYVGYSVNKNGVIIRSDGWGVTDFIEVTGISQVSWKAGYIESTVTNEHCLCEYDEDYNLVDFYNPDVEVKNASINAETKYIRVSFYIGGSFYIKDSSTGNDINFNIIDIKKTSQFLMDFYMDNKSEHKVLDDRINAISFYNKNYIEDCYINTSGYLKDYNGINVSEPIVITNNVITWNYGRKTYYTDAKLVIFSKTGSVLDYYTISNTTTNSRTIDISNKEYLDDASYIMVSFTDGGSVVQDSNTWTPELIPVNHNNIEYLGVGTYNVGAYRINAQWMSESDWNGFIKQLKGFMNGKINQDILFTQEDKNSFTKFSTSYNTYLSFYRQFYPYKFVCRDGWSGIYSKYPLKNCRELDFEYEFNGQTKHRYHALAEININGRTIGLASVHCNFDSGALKRQEFNFIANTMKDYEFVIVAGDFNVDIAVSDVGNCPAINDTFGKAGYKTANWGYWGNIHTQTDTNPDGTPATENQIDSFVVRGFDINSFDVLPVAYYDHMPCVSKLNFSLY